MVKHIRIISPSGHLDSSYIEDASARLSVWGYEISEGKYARDEYGRFAGTDEQRLEDLTNALADPSVDMILCARGGYGLQRIIDRVPPITKPVIGFSDITALHQLAGLNHQPSLHAVMCKHIASLPEDSEPVVNLRKALQGEALDYSIAAHPLNRVGKVEAPIIGGNLSVLYGLQGTPYGLTADVFKDTNAILLIEDIGERHYHIDRMMNNLRLSGIFEHISGLIVGQFTDCDDDESMPEKSVVQTIYETIKDYDFPVVFDAPVGHVEHNLPLWLHTPAQLSVTQEGAHIHILSPLRL